MTPTQLSVCLNRQAEQVCRHLLPNGKKHGHEWQAGDAYGGEGRSLKVVIDGEKVGVGSDFATGETFGDLLDLWCATQSVGLGEAMAQACSYLGIVNDGEDTKPRKEYARPPRPKLVRRLDHEGQVYQYLKSRGMTDQCLEDYRIAEEQGQWMVFPYLREGQTINIKYIHTERDDKGKKQVRQEKGAEPCLFGWDALELRHPTARNVVITEGELDTMTLHQCGIPALSVPNGGGGGHKQDWIDNDYDRLSRFDQIFLCLDNDGPGKEAEKDIIKRLGSERCRIVTLPYKDANECLQHNIKNFSRYLLSAKILDPDELKAADYFTQSVMDKFYPKPGAYAGMKTPWENINQLIKFDEEELIIWTGFSESGKSVLLGQVALQGLLDGEKFCVASMEMAAHVTLWRMVRQISGKYRPPEEEVKKIMSWLSDKVWIVNIRGKAKADRLLEVYKYANRRYNIRNFITDSLMKIGVSEESIDEQSDFVNALCEFGSQYKTINHLVAHQRKPLDESSKPGKFGVRGGGAITDQASTIISIYRNEGKGEQPKYGRKKKEEEPHDPNGPTTIFTIEKHRETGKKGSFGLYFDEESLQFHETRRSGLNYLTMENDTF